MKCLDVLLSSQRHVTMTNEAPRVVAIADADCGQLYLGEKFSIRHANALVFPSIIPFPPIHDASSHPQPVTIANKSTKYTAKEKQMCTVVQCNNTVK